MEDDTSSCSSEFILVSCKYPLRGTKVPHTCMKVRKSLVSVQRIEMKSDWCGFIFRLVSCRCKKRNAWRPIQAHANLSLSQSKVNPPLESFEHKRLNKNLKTKSLISVWQGPAFKLVLAHLPKCQTFLHKLSCAWCMAGAPWNSTFQPYQSLVGQQPLKLTNKQCLSWKLLMAINLRTKIS